MKKELYFLPVTFELPEGKYEIKKLDIEAVKKLVEMYAGSIAVGIFMEGVGSILSGLLKIEGKDIIKSVPLKTADTGFNPGQSEGREFKEFILYSLRFKSDYDSFLCKLYPEAIFYHCKKIE